MADEATIQASTAGTTVASTAPASTPETAPVVSATPSPDEPDFGEPPPLDLKDIDPKLHEQAKKVHEKINQDFRRTYTPKFQNLSAEKKRWAEQEKTWAQKEAQFADLQRQAVEALRDPAKYQEMRARAGFTSSSTEIVPPKMPETVGELLQHMEQLIDQKVSGVRNYADERTVSSIDAYERQGRWKSAEAMLRADPVGKAFEPILTAMARTDPRYREMYDGHNEAQVIESVLKDYKALRNNDLGQYHQQWLTEQQEKAKAATQLPTNPATGAPTSGEAGKRSTEEMIARAHARVNK